MNVFLSVKFHADHRNRAQVEQILAALESCGAHTTCIVRDFEKWGAVHFEARELMRITLREIRKSHLLVVDLTEKGVGVGIEAGYAVSRGISVVTIAQAGSDISSTLSGISEDVFYYAQTSELFGYFQRLQARQTA